MGFAISSLVDAKRPVGGEHSCQSNHGLTIRAILGQIGAVVGE